MDAPSIDAVQAITEDLRALAREKRRHFAPAAGLAVLILGCGFGLLGFRPDLLTQPPWQLAIQIALWVVGVVLFPAIGLGLLFVGRGVRAGLGLATVTLALLASAGRPDQWAAHARGDAPVGACLMLVLGSGCFLVAIGVLSGAFVQRRHFSGGYWVAAGLSLAALNLSTWICPSDDTIHIGLGHLGATLALLGLAVAIATITHRHHRRVA